jgi:hypothetical protein
MMGDEVLELKKKRQNLRGVFLGGKRKRWNGGTRLSRQERRRMARASARLVASMSKESVPESMPVILQCASV